MKTFSYRFFFLNLLAMFLFLQNTANAEITFEYIVGDTQKNDKLIIASTIELPIKNSTEKLFLVVKREIENVSSHKAKTFYFYEFIVDKNRNPSPEQLEQSIKETGWEIDPSRSFFIKNHNLKKKFFLLPVTSTTYPVAYRGSIHHPTRYPLWLTDIYEHNDYNLAIVFKSGKYMHFEQTVAMIKEWDVIYRPSGKQERRIMAFYNQKKKEQRSGVEIYPLR